MNSPEETGSFKVAVQKLREGDTQAENEIWSMVYGELKNLARRRLRGGPARTLTTTVLIHEVYIKLFSGEPLSINDRQHFLALCCRAMRMVMVQHYRQREAQKRQAEGNAITLVEEGLGSGSRALDVVALDEALSELKSIDPRLATIVDFRVFGGLNNGEIAELLQVTTRTVERLWTKAKLLLLDMLQ